MPNHNNGHLMKSLAPLLAPAIAIELFLLALFAAVPLGGVSLSISPIARAWPWLLGPARLVGGDALVDGSVPPEQNVAALALVAALLVGASCAAGVAVLRARRLPILPRDERGLLAATLVVALILGVTMLLLPALPSDDVFSYILYGRITAVHHANPLVAVPSDFPADPFLTQVFWRDVRSVYGPVWLLLSGGLSLLAQALGGSLLSYVLLFKLLGLAAHLANAWLIWRILGVLAPRWRLHGTILYAWNPLCLLECCASAHNDAMMLLLLLLGIYCLARGTQTARPAQTARGWEIAALVAFGLSISIKYVPLALIPFYLAWVLRDLRARNAEWPAIARAMGWRVAVLAAVLVVTILPYWAGPAILGSLLFSPPAQQLNNSLLEAISWPLRALAQSLFSLTTDAARTLVDTALKTLALLAFALLWLAEFRRARSLEGMLRAWGWALFWYALVASGWFWPWYVTWAVVVAALLPWGTLSAATLLLAGGALVLYGFLPLHAAGIYGYRSLFAFGPVLIYLASLGWKRRKTRPQLDRKADTTGLSGELAELS